MTTNVFAAKKALFARLLEESEPGRPLAGKQVSYKWPGQSAELQCVYGGGVRFVQEDAVGERGTLVNETAFVSVYIRVVDRQVKDIVDTDQICSDIAREIAACLQKNPNLTPTFTWSAIKEGAGDYSESDDEAISILSLQVVIGSTFGYSP